MSGESEESTGRRRCSGKPKPALFLPPSCSGRRYPASPFLFLSRPPSRPGSFRQARKHSLSTRTARTATARWAFPQQRLGRQSCLNPAQIKALGRAERRGGKTCPKASSGGPAFGLVLSPGTGLRSACTGQRGLAGPPRRGGSHVRDSPSC